MKSSDLSPTDLAYAAGVIDSDGYIGVHRSDYRARRIGDATQAVYSPRVQVKQVEPQAVDLLTELFGGYRVIGDPTAKRGRPLFVWSVHSAAAGVALGAVLPYLRIKVAQAENALEVCRINSSGQRRRFVVPEVVDGEPLLPLAKAAELAGRSYEVAYQSVRLGNVPFVRDGRRILIPESYIETWRTRHRSAVRRPDITAELDRRFHLAKALNRVGA